jgi:hypothetical protein
MIKIWIQIIKIIKLGNKFNKQKNKTKLYKNKKILIRLYSFKKTQNQSFKIICKNLTIKINSFLYMIKIYRNNKNRNHPLIKN